MTNQSRDERPLDAYCGKCKFWKNAQYLVGYCAVCKHNTNCSDESCDNYKENA